MKFSMLSLSLALCASTAAIPANAQSYPTAPAQPQQQLGNAPASSVQGRKVTVSKGAFKALSELQAAVEAKDLANIPAKLAAAQAVAKTVDDRFMVAQLQLKAAAAVNDNAGAAAALEAILETGKVEPAQLPALRLSLAKLRYSLKEYDKSAATAEQLLAAQPANTDALLLLAEIRHSQNRDSEAVAALQRAIQTRTSAGQKPDEAWFKRAIAFAYKAKLPATIALSRDWVSAFPSVVSWGDALRIYRNLAKPDEPTLLDTLRLARATNSLSGDGDFHPYAWTAVEAYAINEAKSVIEEGIAGKKIDPTKPLYKEIRAAIASKMTNVSRESLAVSAKEAIGDPNARFALRIADAHYGLGDYGRAAELYRSALGKSGADSNLINLRLGMALARARDKAGATAALNAVTGARAELAKYWLIYLATAS